MSGKRKGSRKWFQKRRDRSSGRHKWVAAMTAVLGLIMMSFAFVGAPAQAAPADVCPEGGDWTAHINVNAQSYTYTPPEGYEVVESCYKAGDTLVFGTSATVTSSVWNKEGCPDANGCNYQDISHASFRLEKKEEPPTKIDIPAMPGVTDPCGPNNATWNVPADTDTLNWELLNNGHLTVTITAENTTFTDGSTSHDYGVATDSGETCPPDVIDIPAKPGVTDPCGPNNATWNVPADTDTLNWELLNNGHLTVTITAENVTFPGGATSHDYGTATDSGVVCPEEPTVVPVPTQETVDPCNPQGVTNNVAWQSPLPADTADVDWSESNNGATRTATLIGNAEWSDGTTEPKVFNLPADSGVTCAPPEECPDGYQDEDETKPCYVEREPDERVESGTRQGCKLGGVETTTAVFTTTYSFNEETQAWESSETATSSVTFTPYTAAELKEKGCIKSPPPNDNPDHPTNPPHAGATSGSYGLSSYLLFSGGAAFLLAALVLFGVPRRRVGEI